MTKNRQGRSGDGLYKKRGIWYFRVVDWTGKRRSISTRTRVFSDAQTKRKEHLEEMAQGSEPTGSGRLTLDDAAQRWKDRKWLDSSENTKRTYTTHLLHILPLLGALRLGQINGDTLRRYQIARKEESAATSCINRETKVIGSILRENRMWTRIREDVRMLKEPPSCGRRLTETEMERLLVVAEQRKDISVIFLVMRLMLETGLRHKEVRMLRRRNIDLERKCLSVERAGTKTDAGARIMPMTSIAQHICEDLLEHAANLGSVEADHFLFPGTDVARGHKRTINPYTPQTSFGKAWETLRRLAKVDGTLRMHDMRHHVASDMAEAGVPSGVAMRLMGWSSAAMRKRYEHIQDSSLRLGMDAFSAHRIERQVQKPAKPMRGEVIPFRRAQSL